MKILLIEDDCETASYVARGLREHGHSVDLASDGHEGLMLAIGDAYDALIVDRMLPKLDGLALLKALRASAIGTPVLLLTALPMAFLSGFSWPAEALPWPLQTARWLVPSTAGIQASLQLNQMGASLGDVAGLLVLLLALALGFGALLLWCGPPP